jgi:hypothetical protein
MDESMQASISGDLDIERRLEAYAAVRLSPSALAAARMRARVMREARLSFAAAEQSSARIATLVEIQARRRAGLMRRGAGILLAACLSLGVAGGAMAAAQAGGPFYPTRMWLETITLPAVGAGRMDAEIMRLESRLAEVMAAARSGDQGAVEAALLAYQAIADEAVSAGGGDLAASERLRLALDRHLAVLATVASNVPAQARESIERNILRAIEHNAATVQRIDGNRGGPTKPGVAAPEPNATARPARSPKPTQEPAAAHTPKPDPTPRAEPTANPEATPAAPEPPKARPSAKPEKAPRGPNHPAP